MVSGGTGTHRLTLGSTLDDGSGTALVTAPTGSVTSGLLDGSGATGTVGTSRRQQPRVVGSCKLVAPPVRPPTTPPTNPPLDLLPVLPPVAAPPPPARAAGDPADRVQDATDRCGGAAGCRGPGGVHPAADGPAVTVGGERVRGQRCSAGHRGGLRVELGQLTGQRPGERPQARVEQAHQVLEPLALVDHEAVEQDHRCPSPVSW